MTSPSTLSPRGLAFQEASANHDHSTGCSAEIQYTEQELEILDRDSRALFAPIEREGPGYECYAYNHGLYYGRSSTIQAVKYVCQQWKEKYPEEPRVGVGDISLPDGGYNSRHASHQDGIDVDLALVTNNGKEEPSQWHQSNYSRELTRTLILLFQNNPVLSPRVILFNDPDIIKDPKMGGVQYAGGHDNHIHVRFQVGPNQSAPDYTPTNNATTLKLVAPYMKGETVKALQEKMAQLGIEVDADSVFGKDTEDAVKQFQKQYGLDADGVVGEKTLAKLSELTAA